MALDESAIPAHCPATTTELSSNAAKGFFALTSHLERDLLLFLILECAFHRRFFLRWSHSPSRPL